MQIMQSNPNFEHSVSSTVLSDVKKINPSKYKYMKSASAKKKNKPLKIHEDLF